MAHPVAKITRLTPDGYGGRREGSFAGKTPTTTHPHPVGKITRLGAEGYGVRRCAVNGFAGKAQTTPPTTTAAPKVWALRGGFGRHAIQGNKGYSR